MTPTERMQEIEASRQRLLKNQTSKLSRKLINEVADELHQQEMQRLGKTMQVGDIAKLLLNQIESASEHKTGALRN